MPTPPKRFPDGRLLVIYDYLDFREYLVDWFACSAGRPSQSGFAAAAFVSTALLSAILRGKRNLDSSRIESFNRELGHDDDEADYFRHMVNYAQDGNEQNRADSLRHLQGRQHHHRAKRSGEAIRALLLDLRLSTILELSHCNDWRDDPEWIASQLRHPTSREEAARDLEVLQDLGLMERNEQGVLVASNQALATDHNLPAGELSQANFQMHREALRKATVALDEVHHLDRQYAAMTLSVSPEAFSELKKLTMRYIEEALALADNHPADRTGVCQLSLQLFPQTVGSLQED